MSAGVSPPPRYELRATPSARSQLVRRTIDLVSIDQLSSPLRHELELVSARLCGLPDLSPEAVRSAPDGCFEALAHRLSPAFMELNGPALALIRSVDESAALAWLLAEGGGFRESSPRGFREALGALSVVLTDGEAEWRRRDIYLNADASGTRIRLPDVDQISKQLAKVRRLWCQNVEDPALWKGLVALVLIVNCHPFTDGNGRVARLLFNAWLRRGGMSEYVYFPFSEIARRSRGGYEIALRSLEISGDWEPLVRFVLQAIECHCRLAA